MAAWLLCGLTVLAVARCRSSADLPHVAAVSDAARLMKVALLTPSNVDARNRHCGGIEVACQYALVTHGCMSSTVDQRVGLHSKRAPCIQPPALASHK